MGFTYNNVFFCGLVIVEMIKEKERDGKHFYAMHL
jgi:hypothetical protein